MKTLLLTAAVLVTLATSCTKSISTSQSLQPAEDDYLEWITNTNPGFSGNVGDEFIKWQVIGPSDHIGIFGYQPYGDDDDESNAYRVLLSGVVSHDQSEYPKIIRLFIKKNPFRIFKVFWMLIIKF